MDKLIRSLGTWAQTLRLVDAHDGRVSLTSLLLGAAGTAVVAAPSWPAVAALVVAAGLYGHKRVLNRAQADADETLKELAESVAAASQKLQALEGLKERVTQVDNRTRHLAGARSPGAL